MGGKALKEHGTVRVTSAVEAKVSSEVISVLSATMLEAGLQSFPRKVVAYREKVDHGDIDILVPDTLRDICTPVQIAKLLEDFYGVPIPCVFHGQDEPDPSVVPTSSMISLAVPLESGGRVQVDLIWVREAEMDYAQNYYNWNDLSNLIGVIGKKMGLKFGHKGLTMPVAYGDRYAGEVLISRDFGASLEFLGYDSQRWAQGFDNLPQIFEFASSSRLFDPDLFLREFRNHSARAKERNRTTYSGFLDYLRTSEVPSNGVVWKAKREDYLEAILTAFPDARPAYQAVMDALALKMVRRVRLNGSLVHSITGLDRELLGHFINDFKHHHGLTAFNEILDKGEEHLTDQIKAFHRGWVAPELTM